MKCSVFGCTNGYRTAAAECSLFTFPTRPMLARKWKQFCRQNKSYNFKNCYICMEHFASENFENSLKFEMGFAKKRLLRRGAVPTIYKPGEENPARSHRILRRENKKIVAELLKKASTACDVAFEFVSDTAKEEYDENLFIPVASDEETVENSVENNEVNIIYEDASSNEMPSNYSSVTPRSSPAPNFEDFQKQVEELQQKNTCLQNENQNLQNELTVLKRNYESIEKKQACEIGKLQERTLRAKNAFANMEENLGRFFRKRHVAKLMSDIKRPSHT